MQYTEITNLLVVKISDFFFIFFRVDFLIFSQPISNQKLIILFRIKYFQIFLALNFFYDFGLR